MKSMLSTMNDLPVSDAPQITLSPGSRAREAAGLFGPKKARYRRRMRLTATVTPIPAHAEWAETRSSSLQRDAFQPSPVLRHQDHRTLTRPIQPDHAAGADTESAGCRETALLPPVPRKGTHFCADPAAQATGLSSTGGPI